MLREASEAAEVPMHVSDDHDQYLSPSFAWINEFPMTAPTQSYGYQHLIYNTNLLNLN